MKSVQSRNRTYISPTVVKSAQFKPGDKVAVEKTVGGVRIRSFNKVTTNSRVAAYTVESNGSIRMSSNKIGRRKTNRIPKASTPRPRTVVVNF